MGTGGFQVPEPGGTMKKMQFEFTDPAAAAAQGPQIPEGAGVPPAGAQGAPVPPAGMQPPPTMPSPMQGQGQGMQGGLFGMLAGGGDQMGQGFDSSMLGTDQLAAMADTDMGGSPIDLEAEMMEEQLMQDPQLQMRMMEAARRMGNF